MSKFAAGVRLDVAAAIEQGALPRGLAILRIGYRGSP